MAEHQTYTLVLLKNTEHMAIDGQVYFHRQLFADPVKSQRYTTGSVEPANGINKDVIGATLLPMIVLTYPIDWVCFCHLLKTQHCCLCPIGRYNLPLATHPPQPLPPIPLLRAICDITVTVKKLLKIQQC